MDQPNQNVEKSDNGPRAILRVPEVLSALASKHAGSSLAELSQQLKLPKTSLHRLLRTLEHGKYVTYQAGSYQLGPETFRLGRLIGQAAPTATFPACARPVLEWLANETHESVMLGILSDQMTEMVYVEVIDSKAPLRFTIPVGNRRPLYTAAAGKAVLAFLPAEVQKRYIEEADFVQLTPFTTQRHEMPELLRKARAEAVVFDRNGSFQGAAAIASPAFDRDGQVCCAVSVAGPTERLAADQERIEQLVRKAGDRISRILGLTGDYPPRAP